MKIYKFKDLSKKKNHSHFLQIVRDLRIWCSSPDPLNDKDEFIYELDYHPSSKTASLFSQLLQKYGSNKLMPPEVTSSLAIKNGILSDRAKPIIEKMINQARSEIGITSFSLSKSTRCLWNRYGGKGNGVRIEIDIPDSLVNDLYRPVCYISKKVFHVDSFFEAALDINKKQMYKNMFLTKTDVWKDEEEIRYLSFKQNFAWDIDGSINEIAFGPKVDQATYEFLSNLVIQDNKNSSLLITRLTTI